MIVDLDRRLARPFSYALPFKRPSARSAFKSRLSFLRGAANRIKNSRGCTRDACKTHPQQLVNLSASFTSSSFQCNVLTLSLFATAPPFLFLTRAKWQKREEEE